MIKKHSPIIILILSGLLISSVSLIVSTNPNLLASRAHTLVQKTASDQLEPKPKEDPFAKLKLTARAAIVLDINTGEIIFAKNVNEKMPLASLTKVMTALVAENLISAPNNTTVTITKKDLRVEGDSGLKVGETWRLRDLIDFSLIVSSNDGANAIAGVAGAVSHKDFVTAMNDQAKALSLDRLAFKNETGLDLPDHGGSGAMGSAENIARLFAYIYKTKPQLLEATKSGQSQIKPLNSDPHFIKNTNEVINKIPGILASKTGYTELSGGNLVIIFDRGLNQPAVVAVLNSTQDGRFTDMIQLTEATMLELANRDGTNQ